MKRFVRENQFDRLGVFAYSQEENTWAANHYEDSIPEEIKKARAAELMGIQQEISATLNAAKIGQTFLALVDGNEGDHYIARTESDSPEVDNELLIPHSEKKLKIGHFYRVRITGAEDYDLYGEAE
jgi:ribosomal protein S12 methylthiotransferase